MSSYRKFVEELNVQELKVCLAKVGCKDFKGKKRVLLKRLLTALKEKNIDTGKIMYSFTKEGELKAELVVNDSSDDSSEGSESECNSEGSGIQNPRKNSELAGACKREKKLEAEIEVLRSQLKKLTEDKGNDNASLDKPCYKMVSLLSMDDLKGIAAYGKLNNWYKEVELFCGNADSSRIKGAFGRMDQLLKSTITSCNSLDLSTCSWEDLKYHLKSVLLPKQTFHTAWLELTNKRYDSSRPPREYFIEIMNLHASISQIFHEVPDLHSTVRQLMARDFPKEISDYMGTFLDSKVSFDRFLEELEIHWGSLAKPVHSEAYARKVETAASKSGDTYKVKKSDHVKFNKKQWCHVCYTNSHFTQDCRNKPPPGTCWACKKQGHAMKNCPDYQFFRDQSQKVCRDMYFKLGNSQ